MTNQLFVIKPYKSDGVWMFDDPAVGLVREPFVAGIPEIFEKILKRHRITGAENGFSLLFSSERFNSNGVLHHLQRERLDEGGAWYSTVIGDKEMEGWLCPALLKYFPSPPVQIFIAAIEIEQSGRLRVWAIRNPPAPPEYCKMPNLDAAQYFIMGLIESDLQNAWVRANVFGLEHYQDGKWAEWEDENGEDIMHYIDNIEVK